MTRKALLYFITVMLLSGSLALAQTKPAANQMSGSDSHLVELYLDFLYHYLPLPDRYDYSRAFYEHNVRLSLQTRQEMSWGKRVPEREFRHFVLPIRVNNENLDNSREVFYKELKNRVSGMPMYDAVLEVNHWCHEKVTYRPTDARTSSPLATVRTAYGRCGEESTLLVAALRSVGIPVVLVETNRARTHQPVRPSPAFIPQVKGQRELALLLLHHLIVERVVVLDHAKLKLAV